MNRTSKKIFTKKDKQYIFQWCLAAVIFTVGTVMYFSWFFVHNCIFHWPPRWDIKTCWSEQIHSAQERAAQDASLFAP